ncbi:hypothetical protein AOXY_G37535, partial [Acipenser oxyrinchus oxyrinchus]
KVSKLEELGVETAMMSYDCLSSSPAVTELYTKRAAEFLKATGTANQFGLYMKPSFYGRQQLHSLLKGVKDISFEMEQHKQSLRNAMFAASQTEDSQAATVQEPSLSQDSSNYCCVCKVHYEDCRENSTKKWRLWSQCRACQT